MTQDAPSAPTQRILRVIGYLGQNGPTTLSDLTGNLGFSRTAVWRALDTLRQAGWVRMRQGDQAYMLTHKKLLELGASASGPKEAEQVFDAVEMWKFRDDVKIRLALIEEPGRVTIVEGGTDALPVVLQPLTDPLALCCAVRLSREELAEHIDAAMPTASAEERRSVDTGNVTRQIFAIAREGYLFDERDILIPVRLAGRRAMALELSPQQSIHVESVMVEIASDLLAVLARS